MAGLHRSSSGCCSARRWWPSLSRVELRVDEPMMDVRLFRDRVYSAALVTIFSVLFAVYGMLLIITQYFQNVEAYSPEKAGFLMLAFTLPTVVLSPLSGRIAGRVGGRCRRCSASGRSSSAWRSQAPAWAVRSSWC